MRIDCDPDLPTRKLPHTLAIRLAVTSESVSAHFLCDVLILVFTPYRLVCSRCVLRVSARARLVHPPQRADRAALRHSGHAVLLLC